CGCAMTPTHTSRDGTKRYRYYVCSRATKHGRRTCPGPSVPAAEIEGLVVDRIRGIGCDPALQREVFSQAQQQDAARLAELEAQRRALEKDLARWHAQLRGHAAACQGEEADGAALVLLADLQERIAAGEQQLVKAKEETHALRRRRLDEGDVAAVLG